MTIDGFTYVRNGIKMGYPFIQSIQSILPLVDNVFVAVGDSTDGTRELIESLNNPKIHIIDTVWDNEKRANGEIFREQSNIGLERAKGDWCFHIQADEVIHEDAYEEIRKSIELADKQEDVDGVLFPFLHFWGDYQHIRNTRRTHAFEIRAFKNHRQIKSYKDSQGFRIFDEKAPELGRKLTVIKTKAQIFHYSYTRNPKLMTQKTNYFHRFWHSDKWLQENTTARDFDFNDVDVLEPFTASHPKCMTEVIAKKDWDFTYDPSRSRMSLKYRFLYKLEKWTGYRFFEYRNYTLKK